MIPLPRPRPASLIIRAVLTLNGDLATLDSEYNKLTDCMAQGERDGFDQKWLISTWAHVQRIDSN